jgi:hypothetical protein
VTGDRAPRTAVPADPPASRGRMMIVCLRGSMHVRVMVA